MKHAEGASKLIQLRGPQSFRDEFDCATLLAFKGLLVRLSILNLLSTIFFRTYTFTG